MAREKRRNIISKLITMILTLVIVAGSTCMSSAATTKDITSVSMPSTLTVAVGESKPLNITINPSDTTNVVNVHWGSSLASYVKTTNCKFGSYWDQPASCNVKGLAKGKGIVTAHVFVYDKKDGDQIKDYKLTCNVTITDAKTGSSTTPSTPSTTPSTPSTTKPAPSTPSTTPSTPSTPSTTKPAPSTLAPVAKPVNKYIDASSAYTEMNKFRTTKKVWQWNKGNKSKKYFNTKKSNTLGKLKKSDKLEKVAKTRAKEAATKFSHTRPNGKSCFSAYPSCYTYTGECLGMGQRTGKEIVGDWKEAGEKYSGQGHRRIMLEKRFKYVGIACYEKDGVRYWAACFGN